MSWEPVGNNVILKLIKIESALQHDLYTGTAVVVAKSPQNDALQVGDKVLTPMDYEEIPGGEGLVVANIDTISAKELA
jgi:hypothetical protein